MLHVWEGSILKCKSTQIRFVSQKYQSTSGQVLSAFDGIDLSLFPPGRASLLDIHAQRANY